MRDFEPQFRLLSELQRLGERSLIHKLKKKNPRITSSEIDAEIIKWYLKRPSGEGPGFSKRIDISEFTTKKV